MALQKTITTPFGLEAPSAYAKVSRISGDKHTLDVEVEWYATAEARDSGSPVLHRQAYTWAAPADQLVSDAYDFLKTLEDFSGAVDV